MAAMGIGNVGAPGVIFKRKFRWTLEINTPCGFIPKHYVKTASRPKLEIEDYEINFLNAVSWIPGKGRWQPITVVYRDVAAQDFGALYSWINTVYQGLGGLQDTANLKQSEKAGWNGVANLVLYDGCGTPLENWLLGSVFPISVDFGELDYESSEEVTIELSLRYSEVAYQNLCGPAVTNCCQGC